VLRCVVTLDDVLQRCVVWPHKACLLFVWYVVSASKHSGSSFQRRDLWRPEARRCFIRNLVPTQTLDSKGRRASGRHTTQYWKTVTQRRDARRRFTSIVSYRVWSHIFALVGIMCRRREDGR
jgi:hypothetical protein